MEARPHVRDADRSHAAQVLRARHVPVPVGRRPPRRSPQGLHGDGRGRARQADDGVQRAAGDGLGQLRPARRAPRREERRAPERDHRAQHRDVQVAARQARPQLRLGPRDHDERAALLQVDAVDLRAAVRARARVPRRGVGQLLSRARHRARQRGGPRRQVRRDRRPGREAQAVAVDARDHEVRRAPGRRSRGAAVAERHVQGAARLDRQVGRRQRRVRLVAERSETITVFTTLSRTRCSAAPTSCSRPSTRSSTRSPRRACARRSRRTAPRSASAAIAITTTEAADAPKTWHVHRRARGEPGQRQADPDLDRRLRARQLRHRRGVRVPRARRARSHVRRAVPAADRRGRPRRRCRQGRVHRRRRAREQRVPRRARHRGREGEGDRVARRAQQGRSDHALQAARLAVLAPALLGRAVPVDPDAGRRVQGGAARRPAGRVAADRRVQ